MDELLVELERFRWPVSVRRDRAEVRRVLSKLAAEASSRAELLATDESFTLESVLGLFLLADESCEDMLPAEARHIVSLTRRAMTETIAN